LPMSTRASRLAEYSIVKCGMSGLPTIIVQDDIRRSNS
jgi:hypothetical protein